MLNQNLERKTMDYIALIIKNYNKKDINYLKLRNYYVEQHNKIQEINSSCFCMSCNTIPANRKAGALFCRTSQIKANIRLYCKEYNQ